MDYVGNELILFEAAKNWKQHWAVKIAPYLAGDVLEIGAGFGSNLTYLYHDTYTRWLSVEPDANLCKQFLKRRNAGTIPRKVELIEGTLSSVPKDESFDSILYVDVMEHIENDHEEFVLAFERLNAGGHLIILCPAHQFLFSPFDDSIGHYRRYNKKMYRKLSDEQLVKLEYLDTIGLAASIANKVMLKQTYPTAKQIKAWDSLMVPLSRVIDPILFGTVGKSILGVWRK